MTHKSEDYKISAVKYYLTNNLCKNDGNGKSKTIQNRKYSRPWTNLL